MLDNTMKISRSNLVERLLDLLQSLQKFFAIKIVQSIGINW